MIVPFEFAIWAQLFRSEREVFSRRSKQQTYDGARLQLCNTVKDLGLRIIGPSFIFSQENHR